FAAVRLGDLERDIRVEWNGDVSHADVPAGLTVRVAGREDDAAGQLPLQLDVVLVRHRPLETVGVAVVGAEREAGRDAKLVQLRREIAVEIAAARLSGGADGPGARVVDDAERVDALNVAQRDRLVVAARRYLHRRLPV